MARLGAAASRIREINSAPSSLRQRFLCPRRAAAKPIAADADDRHTEQGVKLAHQKTRRRER